MDPSASTEPLMQESPVQESQPAKESPVQESQPAKESPLVFVEKLNKSLYKLVWGKELEEYNEWRFSLASDTTLWLQKWNTNRETKKRRLLHKIRINSVCVSEDVNYRTLTVTYNPNTYDKTVASIVYRNLLPRGDIVNMTSFHVSLKEMLGNEPFTLTGNAMFDSLEKFFLA